MDRSKARDEVMAAVRCSLAVTGAERPRRAAVDDRLSRTPKGVIPARGQLDKAGQIALFIREAEAAQASVTSVASTDAIPAEVARYLRDANLPARLRRGSDPRLAALPWGDTAMDVTEGASDGSDLVGLSVAFAGIAETGTAVLLSGPDNPTTLNFLPDHHLVVLHSADLAGDLETVWGRLRTRGEVLPRTVNLVTGPSRSGDIEQTLLLGAHGPRRLHIILVDTPAG